MARKRDKDTPDETSDGSIAVNDAWTGMLAVSLLALILGAGFPVGREVDVLFEEKVKDRWRGRTPTNKLVFVISDEDLRGKILPVTITWTGPWSMQAVLQRQPELISL